MSAASQIRAQIEAVLARRIPSALTPGPRIIRPTVSTGVSQLDELLGGGLPVGAITEIVGTECSGRTSLTLAFMSQITRQGKVCAWVDVSDTLHPESAAAAGIDLDRMLWIRCGGTLASPEKLQNVPLAADLPQTSRVHFGGNSPHPRSESKGLPTAIGDLLSPNAKYKRDKIVGTPGAPNRPLTTQNSQKEQVASDRLPARRGAYVLQQREAYEPRCAEPQKKPRPKITKYEPTAFQGNRKDPHTPSKSKPWSRLDQALRVTDLLLQSGGFSAIVLDTGSVLPEHVSRIPLATWFRYRAAAEQTQSSFVLLTQHSCAKSSAGIVLKMDGAQPSEFGPTVFAGFSNRSELVRQRYEQETSNVVPMRKPPQRATSTEWISKTPWCRVAGDNSR